MGKPNVGDGCREGATQSTSPSLIERAKRREQDAWNRLAELYAPMVYARCRELGLRAEDAADTVQEVFAAVAVALADFRGGRAGAFRAWLRTITRNKVYDHFRREDGQASAEGGTSALGRLARLPQPTPSAEESSAEQGDDEVWRCVVDMIQAQFSEHVWNAFWRTTVDAQPPAAVADELGMSVAAVYQAKSRVLRHLRQALRDLELPD